MQRKTSKKDKFILVLAILLVVSSVINIFQGRVNIRYKDIIQQQCYDEIEVIRVKNESILKQLDSSINAKSITNNELMLLYQNYKSAVDAEVNLWEYYFDYKNNPYIYTENNNVSLENENKYELYWKIEELFYNYIQKNLDSNESVITLANQQLDDFMVLREIANEINDYFNQFYDENCKGLSEEERAKAVIKNSYWIDMLKGSEVIMGKYINHQFTY